MTGSDLDRVEVANLGHSFYHRALVRYGFVEQPDIPRALVVCGEKGFGVRA